MKHTATLFLLLQSLALAYHQENTSPSTVKADWRTPAELSNYVTTPRYDETLAYIRRVAAAARNQVRIETFGQTGEGRDLIAVAVSRDDVFDPVALHKANRPIVLIQNAIHAGEMDGKDACLALLRDMVVTRQKAALLQRAVIIMIPIYNVDGHERFGPYNRINQNGPEQMGWRTQARNLNLNRDYLKADAPETRAFLKLWNQWLPDFFVDNHVTDGADFVYDTTYGLDTGPEVFPTLAQWQREQLAPYLEQSVTQAGHDISPFFYLRDAADPTKGITVPPPLPRFSTGYMILQNRPGMLVEMHMLKDYQRRVSGNYELLRALLEVINRDAHLLVKANRQADATTIAAGKTYHPDAKFPLRLELDGRTEPFRYRGYKFKRELSEISGAMRVDYTREPSEIVIPHQRSLKVALAVAPPVAYIIPAQWTSVIEVLAAHGLKIRRTLQPWAAEVETYRCENIKWLEHPFEGRHTVLWPSQGTLKPDVSLSKCAPVREKLTFPPGSAVIPLDQRASRVAIHFLEPEAPDSAVSWGFFDGVFEEKEYAEAYILEKLAREMLSKDPKLKEEFEQKIAADKSFAASPEARLNFFYRRSPWWDARIGLYPVGRLLSLEGIPLAE